MKESINSIAAIILAIEFFFLGGSIFAERESVKDTLRVFVVVLGVVAMAIGW